MGGRSRIRCFSCGFPQWAPPEPWCAQKRWHVVPTTLPLEAIKQNAHQQKVHVSAPLTGEEASKLYTLAYKNGRSMAEEAAVIIKERLGVAT